MGDEVEKVDESTSVRKLAREHGLPAELLAAANGLSVEDSIRSGASVVLPMAPPEGEAFYVKNYERRKGGRMIAYRVRKGDSVQTISRKLGVSIAALRDYNPHVHWSHVRAGQKLSLQISPGKSHYAKHSKKHKGELAMRSKGETRKGKASGKLSSSKKIRRGGASKGSVTSPAM